MSVDVKKGDEAVDVAGVVPTITQQELREYCEQALAIQRRHSAWRISLTERLKQGALIEPGDLTAHIEVEYQKRCTWEKAEAVIGLEETRKLWRQLAPTPVQRLLVLDAHGKDHAWKEWRSRNVEGSIEVELPPTPSASAAISAPLPRLLCRLAHGATERLSSRK